MRRSLLALAALSAAVPFPGRGEDPAPAASTPGPERVTAEPGAAREGRAALAAERPGLAPAEAAVGERAGATAPAAGDLARQLPRVGLAVGGGFPDFATASVLFRPVPRVRLHAGPAWNSLAWGLQGGVTFVPWSFAVSPLLSLQAGRFFGSDLSFVAGDGDGAGMKPLLDDVVLSWASADLGLELGSQRGLCFTLRVGLSYVSIATHGTATRTGEDGTTVALSDVSLDATLPSLKLGVQYWF